MSGSPFTIDELRSSRTVVQMYRCIQIIVNSTNDIMRDYFIMTVNNSLTCIILICNFTLIRLRDKLDLTQTIVVGGTAAASMLSLGLEYYTLAFMNERSVSFKNSWTKNPSYRKKLLLKSFKSIRHLRVEIGSFGFYKKQSTITILGKLILYTAKSLLMTKKLDLG